MMTPDNCLVCPKMLGLKRILTSNYPSTEVERNTSLIIHSFAQQVWPEEKAWPMASAAWMEVTMSVLYCVGHGSLLSNALPCRLVLCSEVH